MKFGKNAKGEIILLDKDNEPLDAVGILARKRGYGASIELEAKYGSPEYSKAHDLLYPRTASELIEQARQDATDVLKEARIFDWEAWYQKGHELNPDAAAAIDVMVHALCLDLVRRTVSHEKLDYIVTSAVYLGMATAELWAQRAWITRNPPLSANAVKKANVKTRREMLADFIRDKGERTVTRPGAWYDKFREAYKDHSESKVSDRTLKADYPHALALLRKRAKSR